MFLILTIMIRQSWLYLPQQLQKSPCLKWGAKAHIGAASDGYIMKNIYLILITAVGTRL